MLHVRDLSRSKKFYVDLLGMKVEDEFSGGIFLRCGRQVVGLFEVGKGERIHAGDEMNHMALRLETGSYRRVKKVLEKAGVEVTGRTGDPHCIYFADPDGHWLQLLTPAEQ